MEVRRRPALILLASPSEKIVTRWKLGLSDFTHLLCLTRLDTLKHELAQKKPPILLLDRNLPGLDGSEELADLAKLSPETKIVILTPPLSDETEWGLFKAGIRGCCPIDIEPKQLKNVVLAVRQGELWIRRTLTCRLLDELAVIIREKNRIKHAASNLLVNLTQREYEIAALVGNGKSNKQIAQHLSITERTVKAHLTEIFRKLDIADRLKLALIVNNSLEEHGM